MAPGCYSWQMTWNNRSSRLIAALALLLSLSARVDSAPIKKSRSIALHRVDDDSQFASDAGPTQATQVCAGTNDKSWALCSASCGDAAGPGGNNSYLIRNGDVNDGCYVYDTSLWQDPFTPIIAPANPLPVFKADPLTPDGGDLPNGGGAPPTGGGSDPLPPPHVSDPPPPPPAPPAPDTNFKDGQYNYDRAAYDRYCQLSALMCGGGIPSSDPRWKEMMQLSNQFGTSDFVNHFTESIDPKTLAQGWNNVYGSGGVSMGQESFGQRTDARAHLSLGEIHWLKGLSQDQQVAWFTQLAGAGSNQKSVDTYGVGPISNLTYAQAQMVMSMLNESGLSLPDAPPPAPKASEPPPKSDPAPKAPTPPVDPPSGDGGADKTAASSSSGDKPASPAAPKVIAPGTPVAGSSDPRTVEQNAALAKIVMQNSSMVKPQYRGALLLPDGTVTYDLSFLKVSPARRAEIDAVLAAGTDPSKPSGGYVLALNADGVPVQYLGVMPTKEVIEAIKKNPSSSGMPKEFLDAIEPDAVSAADVPTRPHATGPITPPKTQSPAPGVVSNGGQTFHAPVVGTGPNINTLSGNGTSVFKAEAGGRVYDAKGNAVDPATLPAGALTPEALSRLKAGWAVKLMDNGGATYYQTDAVDQSTLVSVGGVGTPDGVVPFDSRDPKSMEKAYAAGLPRPGSGGYVPHQPAFGSVSSIGFAAGKSSSRAVQLARSRGAAYAIPKTTRIKPAPPTLPKLSLGAAWVARASNCISSIPETCRNSAMLDKGQRQWQALHDPHSAFNRTNRAKHLLPAQRGFLAAAGAGYVPDTGEGMTAWIAAGSGEMAGDAQKTYDFFVSAGSQ
jgi:hypothetical protein